MLETFRDIVEDVTFETVQDGDKSFVSVKGIAKRADHINENRRFYSTDVLKKAVDGVQKDVKSGKLIGLIRHPDPWQGEPSKGHAQMTAVKWTDIRLEGRDVKVDGIIVKTAAGADLQALVDAGVNVGLSTNMKGAVRYVKAKDVDKSYPDQDAFIQVFDIAEFNTIDVVNNPADHYAGLATDSIMEGLKGMKLDELKEKSPDLYKALVAEARDVAAAADGAADLENELIALKKENQELKAQQARAARIALVDSLMADAKLPKLGIQGKIDLDARFRARLEKAAFSADSEEAASGAVTDLIEEQKALLSIGGDPNTDEDNNPGIKRKEERKDEKTDRSTYNRARGFIGLTN